jgi:ferredoxin-nitrite reductase
MNGFKAAALHLALVASYFAPSTNGFVPNSFGASRRATSQVVTSAVQDDVDVRTGKPTGASFLPEETIEQCKKGSPIEKIKLTKDGTSAFVDVYEYARKIREGEMTWEDVDKADLDNVRQV